MTTFDVYLILLAMTAAWYHFSWTFSKPANVLKLLRVHKNWSRASQNGERNVMALVGGRNDGGGGHLLVEEGVPVGLCEVLCFPRCVTI